MALLGRRAPITASHDPPPRASMKVLRADGQRIDLTRRDSGQLLVATRQGWQATAFSYRDMIGELRYALRLRSHAVARARFYVAEQQPWPGDPIALEDGDHSLDAQLAADAVANFDQIPFDHEPDGFTARLDENLGIAGESWIHIDPAGQFHVRSVSEVSVSPDGRVALQTLPAATAGSTRNIDPQSESLLRCWVPHPEWGQLADSSLRTLLDVCEDVVLAGREQRAAARSRVAANGFLLVPAGLSLVPQRQDEEHDDSVMSDTFMADLTAAMLAPIRDDGDAQAVVPIVLRGEPEDLERVQHLPVQRADPEQLIARQSSALLRLLKGLDVQPEQVDGVGGMNHWGAWIIDARSIRDQVLPAAETIAACMMQAYLQPALQSLGHSDEDIAKITIAVDPSPLAENPNRGQDARDAHAAYAISDESLREALGFDDEDAPDDEEMLRRMAASGTLPPEVTAAILGVVGQQQAGPVTVDAQPSGQTELPAAQDAPAREAPAREAPAAEEGQVTPSRPTPQPPARESGPVTAAAADPDDEDEFGFRVPVDAGRDLANVDAELAERITVAADAALARVLERAGARVRSQAQKDRELAASVKGMDAHLVPAAIGRARVEEFVPLADLLADGYSRLRRQFFGWFDDAAAQIGDILVGLLGIPPRSDRAEQVRVRVTTRLTSRTEQAWQTMADRLDTAAEEAMFRPDPLVPEPGPGEPVDTLIRPQDVEEVLRVAGGAEPIREASQPPTPRTEDTPGPGGFGAGPDVTQLAGEEGAVILGYEWQYRYSIERGTRFAPWHTGLDKTRFATFTDPKLDTEAATSWIGPYYYPGDHQGCFVAGTEVSGPPAVGSFTRPYRGEGVEIRTEPGKLLTGTPNHPILTPHGWVPLGELREGDEVVVASGGEGALPVDDETHQVPALIEDVAAALPMADGMVTAPVPTAPEYFHGDGAGSHGEVTVVRADRRLLADVEAAGAELGGDRTLLLGSEGESALAPEGVAEPLVPGVPLASSGGVGGSDDSQSLLGRGVVVPGESGVASVAGDDVSLSQQSPDDGAATSVLAGERELGGTSAVGVDERRPGGVVPVGRRSDAVLRDEPLDGGRADAEAARKLADIDASGSKPEQFGEVGIVGGPPLRDAVLGEDAVDGAGADPVPTAEVLDGFTGGVATEKIGDVRRVELDCHVYNLSTTTGWYVANGVVVHNCRCRTVPIYAIPDMEDGVVARRLREAQGDPRNILAAQVAAEDTAAGREGTSLQNEVEVRDRIVEAVNRLEREYIDRNGDA